MVIPKYLILIVFMVFFNILLLFNLFETSHPTIKLETTGKPMTTTASCEELCDKELSELRITGEALLSKLKELITEEKFQQNLKEIQEIVGDTGIGGNTIEDPPKQIARTNLRYSCPETYKGSTYGYPLYKTGFVRENCTKRIQPSDSTTLILDRPQATNEQLNTMIDYTVNIFRSVIVVLADGQNENFKTNRKYKEDKVQILRKDKKNKIGNALSDAVRYITTTFTLIAPFLSRFDESTDIERLLHVMELSDADMVGGSIKDAKTGEWDRGCYQTSYKLYTLKYKRGYKKSKYECLYCDYLVSPFLAYTQQLDMIPFNFDLPSSVYMDYFLHMRMNNKIILSCPDVMFYTKQFTYTETQLTPFVEMWNIKKLINSQNKVFWFGCRHSKTSHCIRPLDNTAPPCCRANLADAIKFVHEQCSINNIKFEIQEGTLMGAVKFNNILPWERDADITILSSDFNRFADLKPVFIEKGYQMEIDSKPKCCTDGVLTGGSMVILANGWHIDVFGQHKLVTGTDEVRTKIEFAGMFVYATENPGQSLRNRYGHEIYKHAEHWMASGKKSSWESYEPGRFQKCAIPDDHTCLDQFEADGNLQFEEWL